MSNIRKLTPYQHVRLKTEMYFGSRNRHTHDVLDYHENGSPFKKEIDYVPAVFTAFREILDNCLDEILAHGYGNRVDVDYDYDSGEFTVKDNGRGIPIEWSEEHNKHLATLVLSEIMAGRNFDDRGDAVGTNGIGASGVNFCSEYFIVDIYRDGKRFVQKFTEGDIELNIEDPVIKSVKSQYTGTSVTFKLSSKVFKNPKLPEDFLRARIFEIAVANSNLKMYYNGERIKTKRDIQKDLFADNNVISFNIEEDNFKSQFFLRPEFQDKDEYVYSLVNNIPAFNGGTHIEAFRRSFYNGLLNALGRESRKRKLNPNRTDINDGLMIYNVTFMESPNFDSQSKTRLINDNAGDAIVKELKDEKVFKKIILKYPDWIDAIFERTAKRTQRKDDGEAKRQAKKVLRAKVPELMDAVSKNRQECILFIAEGQSAISKLRETRDPNIHGGIPLTGKIMNVYGETHKRQLENKVLKNIMSSLNISVTDKANRLNLRYGKVYIAADMDQDGCLTGDTEVHTLKYGPVQISRLKDYFGNKPFYVWSRDKNGNQVPGKAHSPRITKRVNRLYEIELDNGEKINATDNHPFMNIDLSYTRADELRVGDSLAPFYYKRDKHNNYDDERLIWDDEYNRYVPEYWLIYRRQNPNWDFKNGFSQDGIIYHIDHIDNNHNNNDPDNLQLINLSEHAKKSFSDYNKSEIKKIKMKELVDAGLEECSVKDFVSHYNHKVVGIKIINLEEDIPVYDITVEEHHNFALSSGCYVHNSNITALLVNFFYQNWPELFQDKENPFIEVFMTPFVIARKGKQSKYWYAHNYEEFDIEEHSGWEITRAKGLGSLQEEDWRHALDNIVSVPIYEDDMMKDTLSLIFGGNADARKDWISL